MVNKTDSQNSNEMNEMNKELYKYDNKMINKTIEQYKQNQEAKIISEDNIEKTKEMKESPGKEDYSVNGTIGLVNLGCCCYFNSAVQNLKNVFPLTSYILKYSQNFNKSGFTFSYYKLIANLINQINYQYFVPREFFYYLQKNAPKFRIGEQNDSSICIMYILNNLEKETKKSDGPNPDVSDILDEEEKEEFKNFIYKTYSNRSSFILDYFYGFQQDLYECRNKDCKFKKYLYFKIRRCDSILSIYKTT